MSFRSVSSHSISARRIGVLGFVTLFAGMLPGSAEDITASIAQSVRQIFIARQSAVVRVEATDRHGKLCGTGFYIDPMGTIFTLYSTVGNASDVKVILHDGKEQPAEVLLADPRSGVALLRVDRESPFIPAGNSRDLKLASPLVCIGYPMDLDVTPSFGMVGGFDRKFFGKYFVTTHIRANIPVQAGFGGAPILNFNGQVVGILIAGLDGGNSCFALPIEAAQKLQKDYARYGEIRHGWVGVTVEGLPGEPVKIAELGPETPAAQSGLREGDVLLQVGDVPVKQVEDVLDASYFLTDGDMVTIRVLRDGQEESFQARAIMHPASAKKELHAEGVPPQFNLLAQ